MKQDKTEDQKSVDVQKKNITKEYKTEDLIVFWYPAECSHSGKCMKAMPEVFNPEKRPWITLASADPEDIIKAIDSCPTGALRYKLPEGSKIDPNKAKGPGSVDYKPDATTAVQIKAVKNGPFLVRGPIRLIDADGELIKESSQMVLCRCGLSKNAPFCDGSHMK